MNISPPGYCDLKYACPGPVWYTSKSFSLPKNNLLSSNNEPVSAKATLPLNLAYVNILNILYFFSIEYETATVAAFANPYSFPILLKM